MTKNKSKQEKRKQKKIKDRRLKARKKIIKKREALRDEARVEREIEKIKDASREKIRPYRKPKDETEYKLSD